MKPPRVYSAICALIEAKADHLAARAEWTRRPDEPSTPPQPSGNTSQNSLSGHYQANELRSGFHRIGFTAADPTQLKDQ